mmetsp:Transcript_3686/g.14485  ORF Transcript_3686/g.14485 Transcript_3686/m.14485 type:complete len:437 (-) Transcript_3686:71-1381(-)
MLRRSACLAAGTSSVLAFRSAEPAYQEESPLTLEPQYTLVSAHVVFRHGARTPVFLCPGLEDLEWKCCHKINYPPGQGFDSSPLVDGVTFKQLHVVEHDGSPRPHSHVDASQISSMLPGGECRMGQLTDVGARQAADLGRELRARYLSLLDPAGSTVEARSTNVARCVATLSAVLGSLLPSAKGAILVKTKKNAEEDLTPNVTLCPRVGQLMHMGRDKWQASPGGIAEELIKALKEKTTAEQADKLGFRSNNFVRYRDWVVALLAHEMPLPWKLSELEIDTLDALGAQQVATLMGHDTDDEIAAARTSLGHFIGEMLQEMSKNKRKLFLVSAHDTTVLPLLIALEIFDGLWPPFCSYISVELWENQRAAALATEEDDDDHYLVRIIYNGEEKSRMALSKFTQMLAPKIPVDWAAECGRTVSNQLLQGQAARGGSHF